jgi:hypothetical protein
VLAPSEGINVTVSSSRRDPAADSARRSKLLTFQTWVFRLGWYKYALAHPDLIPFPLTDRSPCQDPFFDPFEAPERRRPLISGLCRVLKNFEVGDRFIYIARVDPGVASRLELDAAANNYFAVAALRVARVWESHREAATAFASRQYVALPTPTPYPPNLAFTREPEAAAARVCCITFDERKKPPPPRLPNKADDEMWMRHYLAYYLRQSNNRLRAAALQSPGSQVGSHRRPTQSHTEPAPFEFCRSTRYRATLSDVGRWWGSRSHQGGHGFKSPSGSHPSGCYVRPRLPDRNQLQGFGHRNDQPRCCLGGRSASPASPQLLAIEHAPEEAVRTGT